MQICDELLGRCIDFRILQSPLSILHNYTERKTFLPGINAFAGIDIEQSDLLDEARAVGREAIEQRLQGEALIDHDSEIADDGRVA